VHYLESPPTAAELDEICRLLGVEPTAIVRPGEKLFRELGLALTDERSRSEWLDLLAAHPQLIERPIVVSGDRAVVGRPPETVLELL
jgi:arsenate reductase